MTAALTDPRPIGLHRIWATPYTDSAGTILSTTSYRLPIARKAAVSVAEDYVTLDGDDKAAVDTFGKGKTVAGSLEAGGYNMMFWSIMTGSQIIEDGVSPNRTKMIRILGSDQSPYFRLDAQAISNTGGDWIARVYRCKCNGKVQFDLAYGTFQMPNADFQGTPLPSDDDDTDYLVDIIQNESKTTLTSTPAPNPLPIPSNLVVGTIAATSVGLSWNDIATADSYKVEQSTDSGVTWTAVQSTAGGAPTTASTSVTGLTTATAYQFRVAAVFGTNTGEYSTPVSVTTS